MSVSDDSVKVDLLEIRGLKLERLKNPVAVNLIGSCLELLVLIRSTPEPGRDQSRADFVEKAESQQMGTARDLYQLGEPFSNLSFGQGSKESEIKQRVRRRVIGTKAVLVVAIVDGDFMLTLASMRPITVVGIQM